MNSLIEQAREARSQRWIERLAIVNSLMGISNRPIVSDGFINYDCNKYYAGELKAFNGQAVDIVEQDDRVLQAYHNGEFICFVQPTVPSHVTSNPTVTN